METVGFILFGIAAIIFLVTTFKMPDYFDFKSHKEWEQARKPWLRFQLVGFLFIILSITLIGFVPK